MVQCDFQCINSTTTDGYQWADSRVEVNGKNSFVNVARFVVQLQVKADFRVATTGAL